MIRDICKDELFLARKAAPALPEDLPIAQDLLETLIAHKDGCVGMAANMIGVAKRIIAFESEDSYLVMFNPVILKKSGPYETEEGCLSLTGTRKTKRWQTSLKRLTLSLNSASQSMLLAWIVSRKKLLPRMFRILLRRCTRKIRRLCRFV